MGACEESNSVILRSAVPEPAVARAHESATIGAATGTHLDARGRMRLLVPSLLAAALLSTAQPALANFIQTDELRGTGVVSNTDPHQGTSVALSAAGNTAIVGAPIESNSVGGVYVFIRNPTQSGVGAWTQQARLSGSHTQTILVQQGWSVALSADGNTAIWGGPGDNNTAGAAWVFTRSPSGGWT